MANYCCTIRTNYFHVKDQTKFLDLMDHSYGCEDVIKILEEKDENGEPMFGFALYGCILGFTESKCDEDSKSPDYNEFIKRLQQCVADDDAIIILEAGNEKLRYVVGSAAVITSSDIKHLNMQELAAQEGAKMLNNPKWKTRCEY